MNKLLALEVVDSNVLISDDILHNLVGEVYLTHAKIHARLGALEKSEEFLGKAWKEFLINKYLEGLLDILNTLINTARRNAEKELVDNNMTNAKKHCDIAMKYVKEAEDCWNGSKHDIKITFPIGRNSMHSLWQKVQVAKYALSIFLKKNVNEDLYVDHEALLKSFEDYSFPRLEKEYRKMVDEDNSSRTRRGVYADSGNQYYSTTKV